MITTDEFKKRLQIRGDMPLLRHPLHGDFWIHSLTVNGRIDTFPGDVPRQAAGPLRRIPRIKAVEFRAFVEKLRSPGTTLEPLLTRTEETSVPHKTGWGTPDRRLPWAPSQTAKVLDYIRGIEEKARRRPITRAEILAELSKRSGYRVNSDKAGRLVGATNEGAFSSCHYIENGRKLLGLEDRCYLLTPATTYVVETGEIRPWVPCLGRGRKLRRVRLARVGVLRISQDYHEVEMLRHGQRIPTPPGILALPDMWHYSGPESAR